MGPLVLMGPQVPPLWRRATPPPPLVFCTFLSSKVLCPGPVRSLPIPRLFSQPDYFCKPRDPPELEHPGVMQRERLPLERKATGTLRHSVKCHMHGLQPARPLRHGILQAESWRWAATITSGESSAPGLNPGVSRLLAPAGGLSTTIASWESPRECPLRDSQA